MTRKPVFWLLSAAGVMLLLPWLVVTCVRSDVAMGAVMVLFFAVDPGFSMAAGYYAGKQTRNLWWVPAMTAGLYLAGAWLFFEMGDPAFWTYAGIYFAVGMEAMMVSGLITGRRENNG